MPLDGTKRKGRGTNLRPANRFEATHLEDDFEHLSEDDKALVEDRKLPTQFLSDQTKTVIATNNSPDIPFRYSVNPYRGCEHGCAYCYARPGHEYLGMNAGLDFESKILVKHDCVPLLRKELCKPSWKGDFIALSGVTDCYQPAERRFRLTRGLLEVMLEARQAVGIITKNALVRRDLDLLAPLAERNLVHVFISVTTLDADLARKLEPRTATPAARLEAIRALRDAGVPVGVMVAPIIPGLNDEQMPGVLQAVANAGAVTAHYTLLRLPLAVEPVFRAWLADQVPLRKDRIEALIQETRSGQMSDSSFGQRMRGEGVYAKQLANTFAVFKKKYQLDGQLAALDTTQFRRPRDPSGQKTLF